MRMGEIQRPPVRKTFTGLLIIAQATGVGRPTYQAIGNAVTVFVRDDAVLEIAIALRTGLVPQEHLHARLLPIRWRPEVGVVHALPVLRFGIHRIATQATATMVVDLEVAADFIETEGIGDIVDDVVHVEQVGHRRRFVAAGLRRQIQHKRAIQCNATVRRAVGVGLVAGAGIGIGVDVVAARDRVFGTGGSVGVMPTEGRGQGQMRIAEPHAAIGWRRRVGMRRTFHRHPEHVVIGIGGPADAGPDLAGMRIDVEVGHITAIGQPQREIPHQADLAGCYRQQHQTGLDRPFRQLRRVQCGDLSDRGGTAGVADRADHALQLQGCGHHGLLRIQRRPGVVHRQCEFRHELVVE